MTSDSRFRMLMTSVQSGRWSRLNVVGIHADDRISVPHDFDRGQNAGHVRQTIDAFWQRGRPLIVMGDFNADPYHLEMSAGRGLLALRDEADVHRAWGDRRNPEGPQLRGLYNPMWRLLPESKLRPGGTLRLGSADHGIPWRIYDQVLVSADLIPNLAGDPEILSRIAGESLLTKAGNPRSDRISDHLPVQLLLNI